MLQGSLKQTTRTTSTCHDKAWKYGVASFRYLDEEHSPETFSRYKKGQAK